ncbi:MAG: transglycosylase family protein [Candidatus Limnocylindria bacterium]
MPDLLRRILLLAAISVGGLVLFAPLAVRSATPVPPQIRDGLLAAADAPQPPSDRGGLSGRQGPLTADVDPPQPAEQLAEQLEQSALPTSAAAPMEATLHVIPTPVPTPVPTPAPTPPPAPQAPEPAPQRVVTYDGDTVWDDLAQCESGGNWAINTGNGYYGGLQFDLSTWQAYGGAEFAAYPHEATREEQIAVAERLRAARGFAPWPACRIKLGLP